MYPTRSKDGPANAITGKVRPQYLVKPDWKSTGSWPTPLLTQGLAVHPSLFHSMTMTDGDHLREPISGCFVYVLLGMAQTIFIYLHPDGTSTQPWNLLAWAHQTPENCEDLLTKKGQRIMSTRKNDTSSTEELKDINTAFQCFWCLNKIVAGKTFKRAKVIAEANLGPWAAGLPMQGYSMWASRRSYRCSNWVVTAVSFSRYMDMV